MRNLSLGDCFQLIDQLLPQALESSAHLLLAEELPLKQVRLSSIQDDLRQEARRWLPELTSRFGSGEGQLRTAMKLKGDKLADRLGEVALAKLLEVPRRQF